MSTQESPTHVAPSTRYWMAVGCYIGLILLLIAWMVWLDPPPASLRSPLLVVFLLPLLLGVRGVLHGRRYTLQWTGMLVLVYFVHGLIATTGASPQRWLGVAETLLTLGYFGLMMLVLRDGKRAHKANKPAA
ncbi:MAG: DUF2069 domain-containing protein [Spiribacter sp.]|nr:DUF2069 domain-containing protein [Spiribacter sp.]MDR9480211.1 DUF2069 domain-containing protein [Spiribacter sp.]